MREIDEITEVAALDRDGYGSAQAAGDVSGELESQLALQKNMPLIGNPGQRRKDTLGQIWEQLSHSLFARVRPALNLC
jgi:hypothetical protein